MLLRHLNTVVMSTVEKPLKKLIILSTEKDLNIVEYRIVLHIDGPT